MTTTTKNAANVSANLPLAALAFAVLCIVAMPTQAQTGQPAPLPLPAKVEANLPGDVAGQDVRLVKGCYVYIYEGEVFPLEDASGRQICK